MATIYKIVDNTNGNIYVGSTINYIERKYGHKNKKKTSSKQIIDNDDYKFIVIEECDESLRFQREEFWINNLDTVNIVRHPYSFNQKEYNKKWNANNKEYKKQHNITRNSWIFSFGETCRDWNNLTKIHMDLFD